MPQTRSDDGLGALADDLAAAALALARRFANGATLWCWAPGAPQHAEHVSVEFVHPVIMGTRALPAVALVDGDAVAALRPNAQAGDVLLVVGGTDEQVAGPLRRAEAWGVTTIWLGAGPAPSSSRADHRLWLTDDEVALADGRVVLGYHLLWELTHVCFEHPGLLAETVDDAPVCLTCSDEGRLAEVVQTDGHDATVRSASGMEHVSTMLVGPVEAGDLVLVHAGTAITLVDA